MKILLHYTLSVLLLLTTLPFAQAQTFTATYPFTNIASGSGGYFDPTPIPTATGVSFGGFTAVPSPGNPFSMGSNPNAAGRFSFTGWPTGATNGSDVFTGNINTTQYYQVTVTPLAGYNVDISSISFTLQRSGTGIRQYAVRSSVDGFASNLPASINPSNATLSVVADNIFQVTDASTTAQSGSVVSPGSTHTALNTAVSFRFYGFNAEGSGGTFSIDNVVINGSAAASGSSPVLTLSAGAINFPGTNIGVLSNSISYTVSGSALQGPVTLNTASPFSISTDNVSYGTTLNIPASEVEATKTIYVKALPPLAQAYNGAITHNSTGAAEKSLALTVQGIDPSNLMFDFNSCTLNGEPGGGFTQFSVAGAQTWSCTSFGRNGTNGVNMNGFSGSALDNEDWLISPAFNLTSGYNIPVLRFYSRAEFAGPDMQVLVSTNYSGAGNPNNATWNPLPANLPIAGSNNWTLTDNIDLSAYKTSGVYIAFKYTSSVASGAARWTIDDLSITNASQLLNVTPATIDFGEQSVGSNGASQPITVAAKGYGDLNFSVPSSWQLSTNNSVFNSSIVVPEATATSGTTIYARYRPVDKKLKDTAILRLVATGFDDTVSVFYGSSYPKAETLDIACWNMLFFGSNGTNNATQSFKNQQKLNAKTVLQKLNADLVGFEEVSSDSLLNQLVSEMPGYASIISPRYSYSFNGPDPNFPAQKIGFLYQTANLTLTESRVMFEELYDAARSGSNTIPAYPTVEGASSFWASGRLPFMASFTTYIGGVNKTIRAIVIHGKSGGSSVEDYNRRMYDVKVLKDTLDAYYANDNIVIVGDYNDDIIASIFNGQPSPYKPYYDDVNDYSALTAGFSASGKVSFVGGAASMIDHHIISNDMVQYYVAGSTAIEDPRNYISSYTSTTSDHLPVYSRYSLNQALPVVWNQFNGWLDGNNAVLQWSTTIEASNSHFIIERAGSNTQFAAVGKVKSNSFGSAKQVYTFSDATLTPGVWLYRIRQVDVDGRYSFSKVITLRIGATNNVITLYPNPVQHSVTIALPSGLKNAEWTIINAAGKTMASGNGSGEKLVSSLQTSIPALRSGLYVLQVHSNVGKQILKLVKE